MNRQRAAHALLIGAPNHDGLEPKIINASKAIDTMQSFLSRRFSISPTVLYDSDATRKRVLEALDRIVARARRKDLVVVMFAGHGKEVTVRGRLYQAWALAGSDHLTDAELATALARPGVDCVVMSDCCLGQGMFTAGDDAARALKLQKQATAFAPTQALRKKNQKNVDMVCISSASSGRYVITAMIGAIEEQTVSFANEQRTYAELDAHFDRTAASDAAFNVDARPPRRLTDQVLAAQ